MCLTGSALSVEQYAKKVNLKDIAKGERPFDTVLAWRTWKLPSEFTPPTLRSESQSESWVPGKPMRAHAAVTKAQVGVGIHAYKTIEDLRKGGYVDAVKSNYKQRGVVIGQVLLWGMIAEHSNGYRAEFGYPFMLYVNGPELQTRLAETYGCFVGRDFIPRILAEAA